MFAGVALKTNALQAHDNANEVAKTAAASSLLMPAGLEGFQRHLNDTGVPSMEAKLETFEAELRQRYPSMSSPGKSRQDDDAQRAPEAQPGAKAQTTQLNDPVHPNHAMFASALKGLHEEDEKRGREPHPLSVQMAGSLVCTARQRELSCIGFFELNKDGSKAYMTDTKDPSAEWARTAVGDVARASQQPMPDSSERVAEINQSLALTAQRNAPQPTLDPSQNDPGRGPKMG